jgi:hypothetical protein
MLKQVSRKLAAAAMIVALVTPAAFAGNTPTGTDPEPGVAHIILVFLGLA